jgi:hypothetical protein
MLVKSDNKMIVHLGIACYDKLKNIILPIQVLPYYYYRHAENKIVKLYTKEYKQIV